LHPPLEIGNAFVQNLSRRCAAANLACGLAIIPMPTPALLKNGALAGADPHLGHDLVGQLRTGSALASRQRPSNPDGSRLAQGFSLSKARSYDRSRG
jgi:hypothetical protein